MKSKKIIKILGSFVLLLFIGDAVLVIADQFIGTEKGVIFGYNLYNLILKSNILFTSALAGVLIIYISITYSKILKKYVLNSLVSMATAIIVLLLVELTFFILLKVRNKPCSYAYEEHDYNLFRSDPILGYAANVNIEAWYRKLLVDPLNTNNKDTNFIFNTKIFTDSLGFRRIDIPNMQARKKYALFFGCSFTFGLGVENNETIPYYFAQSDTSFCAYNFAITGYGPQNMLALLENYNLRKSVKQDSGLCFYIYMDSHPYRVIGDMRTYTTYGHDLPYYAYKNDSVHRYGLFKNDRFFVSGLYTLLSKSSFVKYFNLNFPPKLKAEHYKLTCDIILNSYKEYKKHFRNDNFYVVIYPSSSGILQYLNKFNIKVIDFTKLFDTKDRQYYISEYDKHPSALANRIIAADIAEAIKKNKTYYASKNLIKE
jgi:hypothetical protein